MGAAKVDCHHSQVEAAGRFEKLEIDRLSEGRRKALLIHDSEDVNDRLESQVEKLRKTEKMYEEEDEAREVLEAKEAATEQRLDTLEGKVKKVKRELELNQMRLGDG